MDLNHYFEPENAGFLQDLAVSELTDFYRTLQVNIEKIPPHPESAWAHHLKGVVDFILTNDTTIQDINRRFREKDSPTDVITFPLLEEDPDGFWRGEVYISVETAAKQATILGLTLLEEIFILSVHGILHAIGYDHELSETDSETMKSYERNLLASMQLAHLEGLTT